MTFLSKLCNGPFGMAAEVVHSSCSAGQISLFAEAYVFGANFGLILLALPGLKTCSTRLGAWSKEGNAQWFSRE
jgi:hypothetical protein